MNGRERIITALEIREPDRVPLYIHGINEGPIIKIAVTVFFRKFIKVFVNKNIY